MISNYFPLPEREVMGIWALHQAKALARSGCEVSAVVPIQFVPRIVQRLPIGAAAKRRLAPWARCPAVYRWGEIEAHYPRWPLYNRGWHKGLSNRFPQAEARFAWRYLRSYLLRMISTRNPDVILAHGTWLSGYLAGELRRVTGTPFVTMDHSFEEIESCERYPARRRHYQAVGQMTSAAIAVSGRMEDDIRRLIRPRQTVTLPMAANPTVAFDRDSSDLGRTIVFSAGGFYRRKEFPTLVKAFARIAHRHPEATLRIAGDGVDRPAVESAIASAGLGERVELLGFVPHGEVLRHMASCDIFALPSRDEPFGVTYIEAMAAGRPTIWGDHGGVNDVLENGVHGLRVEPGNVEATANALDALLAEPPTRLQMGEAARALHAEKLTWDAHAQQLLGVLTGGSAS